MATSNITIEQTNESNAKAIEKANKHNETLGFDMKNPYDTNHFEIAITGAKGCYYTLYFYSRGYNNACSWQYIQNLSQDAEKAFDKVMSRNVDNLPIIFVPIESINNIISVREGDFPFGKYKGKKIETIWKEDNNYCIWLLNTLEKENKVEKEYKGEIYYLTPNQELVFNALTELKNQKQKSFPSIHLGVGMVANISVYVFRTFWNENSNYGQAYAKFENDKYFMFYVNNKEQLQNLQGKNVAIKKANTKPYGEFKGIKINLLTYIQQ